MDREGEFNMPHVARTERIPQSAGRARFVMVGRTHFWVIEPAGHWPAEQVSLPGGNNSHDRNLLGLLRREEGKGQLVWLGQDARGELR